MSSLAGAVLPNDAFTSQGTYKNDSANLSKQVPQDIEMQLESQPEADGFKQEAKEEQDQEMTDLFGNDQDLEEIKGEGAPSVASPAGSEKLATPEAEHRRALEYAEEEEPGTVVEQIQEADVSFPNIPLPRSSDGDHWVIRMPNYVTVDSKPYHSDTYVGPEQDEDEALQAETLREKSNVINLKVQNTVRWRWFKDGNGNYRKQSNSRIIRWSDGTLSLRLGKELFDITQTIDTSGAIPRQAFGSQSQGSQLLSQPAPAPNKSQGLTYLVAQHKRAQVLQSEVLITGFMSLRPTGMQSETHRMLVRAVGQKHNKVARLRIAPDPTMDPEREVMELMKQSAKKSKKKIEENGYGGRRRRSGHSKKRTGDDVWSDDDEPEYGGSEDDNMGSGKTKSKTQEDSKKGGDYQEDDFLVADSSDEDGGEGGFDGGRKSKRRRDDEMEEDPLDRLDAKIREREEEEKKRRRRESGGSKDGGDAEADSGKVDEQMDIESEEDEDEEEFKVRRTGAGAARKKRAIEEEEEE